MATEEQYYAEFEGRSTGPSELGNYQFITLEDIINNYMVLYSDEGNHGGTALRRKVEAFAQRGIQEYSYDTFKVKDWEYEVIDRATFPMPIDYVELVGINYVDENGVERWLSPRKNSSNPTSPLQYNNTPEWEPNIAYASGTYVRHTYNGLDGMSITGIFRAVGDVEATETEPQNDPSWTEVDNGDNGYVYNSDGSIIVYEDISTTQQRFDTNDARRNPQILSGTQAGYNNFNGYFDYGRRYYASTETLNSNPTYYINDRNGVIDLDPILIGEVINLKYISDGLSSDLSEVKVHKFAEQAIYEYIYFEMIARNSRIPANEKERAKRRMVAKHRQAKLRLMGLSPRDLIQTLRAQAKWIKT